MQFLRYSYAFLSLLMVCFIPCRSAQAQQQQLLDQDTLCNVQEIRITAFKNGMSLRQQPSSSTILDSEAIREQHISAIKEIVCAAPNLFIPDYGSRTTSSMYVRGMGSRIDQPVMGLIVDNVPIADKSMFDMDLTDIQSIEVIRGPQSALYGKNTMGGMINIRTISPLSFQGVRASAQYGSRNSFQIRASSYQKIEERFGFSISGSYSHTDGMWRNMYDNRLCDKENNASLRTKFQYRGTYLSLDNTLSLDVLKQGGYPYRYIGNPKEETHSYMLSEINYNQPSSYRRTGVTDALSLGCLFSSAELMSITSLQYLSDDMMLDNDFLPQSYFTLEQIKHRTDIAEEIVLRSRNHGRYSWIAGANISGSFQKMEAPVIFMSEGINSLILDNINSHMGYKGTYHWGRADGEGADEMRLDDRFRTRNVSAAIYHQSKLKLGRFTLQADLRIQWENIQMKYTNSVDSWYTAVPADGGEQTEVHMQIHDSEVLRKNYIEFLPRVSASWNFGPEARNMLYLSISKGFKAGGFNTQMFSEVLQRKVQNYMGMSVPLDVKRLTEYDPEQSWNYEAGIHCSWPHRRISVDAALFYIQCLDQQLTVFPEGQTTGRMMTNAGRSRSFGVEAQISYSPLERLELNASYGYTNAKFTKYISGTEDYQGKFIPYAPQHTLSVRASYIWQLSKRYLKDLIISASCNGAGRIWWNERNDLSQPFYCTLDCSVTYSQGNWSVGAWMKNCLDKRYDVFYFESMNNRFMQYGRKRMAGIRFELKI